MICSVGPTQRMSVCTAASTLPSSALTHGMNESILTERMNECMNEWMNEWMNAWMDGWMNEWMDEWMNGWMDGWTNEWVDDWLVGWLNERTEILLFFLFVLHILKVKREWPLMWNTCIWVSRGIQEPFLSSEIVVWASRKVSSGCFLAPMDVENPPFSRYFPSLPLSHIHSNHHHLFFHILH